MRLLPLILLSAAVTSIGCKPAPKVTQYEVKSEAVPATTATPAAPAVPVVTAPATPVAPPMAAPASMKAEAAGFTAPKWAKLPANWSVGPENAMRKATFIVVGPNGTKAELAVTVFPGSVGGLTANVNRWRGQIGLAPASGDEIAASAKPIKVGTAEGQRFTMVADDGAKAVDAAMVPHDGATWFLKMSGDAAAVAAAATDFATFLAASQLP